MGREISGEADECAQQSDSGHGSAVEPAALGCPQVGQRQRPPAHDTAVCPSPLSTPGNDDGHSPRTVVVARLGDSRRDTETDTCSMGLTCFKSWKYDSTTQKGGNRDVLVSPGSYFFLSNSCGQGEEWLKSLNKGVWIPFTGVFGQRLEETVLYERRYGVHMAPLVVEQCVDFIRERGLTEVGLFRQPGQATLVKELQEAFDAGEKPSFDSTDVHTVASLLKLYLRELPEPLVPFSRYPDFLICGKRISADKKQGLLELRSLLHDLPVANFNLLNYICQFLSEVQTYSSSNKMSIENLATVFGPNILRPKAEDPESIIGGAAVIQHLMSELIREQSLLFSKDRDTDEPRISRPAPLSHRHSNQAEWMCTELEPQERDSHLGVSADCLSSPHPQASTPCSRQLSLPLTPERRVSAHHSPRERRKSPFVTETGACQLSVASATGPSLTDPQSYSPAPSKGHSPQDTGLVASPAGPSSPASSQTVVLEIPSQQATDWSGVEEEPSWTAEKDQAGNSGSSDAQEDSTLSVYDNMDTMMTFLVGGGSGGGGDAADAGSAIGTAEAEGGTSPAGSASSWSSCEVLLQDSVVRSGSAGPTSPCQASVSFPSLFREGREDGDVHPNSPASSSAPTDAPLSTGSSEVFLPSAPLDPHMPPTASHAMHCLLAGLRQQMARQKAEYEARIQRLERKNEVLQTEVEGLRSSLEQQRRWFSVAEIKMRNVERARADADRRNAALQKEMEQFFDTFGDLTTEAKKTERIIQSF
ncbi:rho GTPase-activating protein 24 isoform X2 [Alosa pseudoharengus]|uniref:rho GTPase-activating protein 24 isoform X2 n=1 Tax=Alosa pseudoharengus TaxID=34774 RepID=UPI003F8C2023